MTPQHDVSPFDPSPAVATASPSIGPVPLTTSAAHPRLAERVEWPTVVLATAIHAGWLAAVVAGGLGLLPLWLWGPLAAWCVAWQSSLQHEVIHGHPTPSAIVNRLIAGPPLALWLPYDRYRTSHLLHHVNERLTDPLDDPESYYVTAEDWRRSSRPRRALLWVLNTLVGRLVLGPPWAVSRFVVGEARLVLSGDRIVRRAWAGHLLQAGAVLAVLSGVVGVSIWHYGLVAWAGTSLMLLRSFAEHRPAAEPAHRSAVVESRGPLAWLYLSNNLHALHHERPGLPWFVLSRVYWANRDSVLARNGGYLMSGYSEVARRWLLTPRDHPRHPGRSG